MKVTTEELKSQQKAGASLYLHWEVCLLDPGMRILFGFRQIFPFSRLCRQCPQEEFPPRPPSPPRPPCPAPPRPHLPAEFYLYLYISSVSYKMFSSSTSNLQKTSPGCDITLPIRDFKIQSFYTKSDMQGTMQMQIIIIFFELSMNMSQEIPQYFQCIISLFTIIYINIKDIG